MALNFADVIPVDLVHTAGVVLGAIVVVIVLFEFVRWRGVLSPIAKGFRLGAGRWFQILIATIADDVIYQQISQKCPDRKWFAHSLVFWGFLLLSASTTLNYVTNPRGDPLALTNAVRMLGNLGGVILLGGLVIVLIRISTDQDKREVTFGADYLFIGLLLLATATGFLSEFAGEFDAAEWIFGIYAIHLVSSAVLLILAPFTRFIHALGRPVIRLSERYLEALGQEGMVQPTEVTIMPLLREEI
jgi:hypothetical protein